MPKNAQSKFVFGEIKERRGAILRDTGDKGLACTGHRDNQTVAGGHERAREGVLAARGLAEGAAESLERLNHAFIRTRRGKKIKG